MPDIVLRQLNKSFDGTPVLENINMQINDGELTVVVGPSGCGKSTLLRIIAGLEDPDSGDILFASKRVNKLLPVERNVAMVFQSFALYPHMTVFENLAFPLKMLRLPRAQAEKKIRKAANILGIDSLLDRKPAQLSGGQQQRVAMGRAIVRDPAVYLFDEPLSNIDAQLRSKLREEIAHLHQEMGGTMIFVTHDQMEAMTLADRIVVLNAGSIEQSGSPLEIYHRPANLFVAKFFGAPQMNVLHGIISAKQENAVELDLSGSLLLSLSLSTKSLHVGDCAMIGIRAEDFKIADIKVEEPTLLGKTIRVEQLGVESHVTLETEVGNVVIIVRDETAVLPGEIVRIKIPLTRCHLFDAQGRAVSHPIRKTIQAVRSKS